MTSKNQLSASVQADRFNQCVTLFEEISQPSQSMKEQECFLNVKQCAERYNISERHFRTLVDLGEMPKPLKFGRSTRWSIRILEEFESKKIQKALKKTAGIIVSHYRK